MERIDSYYHKGNVVEIFTKHTLTAKETRDAKLEDLRRRLALCSDDSVKAIFQDYLNCHSK